jgi:hypothetical protein
MRPFAFLLLFTALTLHAQEIQVEVQVPVDTAGTIVEISPELRNRAHLFPEVETFISARLFRHNDSTYVLEVSFRKEGVLVRRRSYMNPPALMDFRTELSGRLAATPQSARLNQEGRPGLVVRQTMMGLGFYGWAVPAILHIEGGRESVASYMLVGAAGFALPYYLTQNRPVSKTQTMLTFYGATRGVFYGAFFKNMMAPNSESPESNIGLPLLGSIFGSCAGFHLAGKKEWELGRAEVVGVVGDFGTGFGMGTAHIAGLWQDDGKLSAAHATTLGMTGMGFVAGSWLSTREHYTRGDAYVLRMDGILGAQIVMPLIAALADKEEKAYTTGAMLGGALGVGIGNALLRKEDFSDNEGVLITCGHIAGGLLAGGITYLLDSRENFDGLVYHTTIALGSLAGHALLYRTFSLRN